MNSALRRLLVPLLRDVQAGKPLKFRHRSAAGQALFLVQRKPSPSRKKPALARKEAKRTLHRESTSTIREAVFQRAQNICEGCGLPATEMHHLEGGSTRRSLQAVSNCMALCMVCHREYHHDPERFRQRVLAWVVTYDYPIPRRFLWQPKDIHASLRPAPAAASPIPPGEHSGTGQEEG